MNSVFMKFTAVALFALASQVAVAEMRPSVIYGTDSRQDLFEISNPRTLDLADSTVALVKASKVLVNGNVATLSGESYGEAEGLCSNERFYDQTAAAHCSGALIGEDLLLTAGHCVTSQESCNDTQFVFGYAIKNRGERYEIVDTKDVYSCARLIAREQVGTGADWAIIKLDRKVIGHTPLKLKRRASVVGGNLTVIGHPSGLPTKVATGKIRSTSDPKFLLTNLDTYAGNSGSSVFDTATGEVEGILVRGERDFAYDSARGCVASYKVDETAGRGEDVTKISAALPAIDAYMRSNAAPAGL